MKKNPEEKLPFREVANKIIHSSKLEWELAKFSEPRLICHTQDTERWIRAEIDIVAVAAVCGGLMS